MLGIVRMWWNWKHGRKFARKGKGCKFTGKYLDVEGHVEIGDHCRFRNNVIFRVNPGGKIVFGNRSGASYNCIFEASQLIQVGDNTGIAEFTVIRDSNHLVYGTDVWWRITPLIAKPIIIGNAVLIGSGCYIHPGVTIGDGAVLSAGSIVTKDVGPYEIWAGAPARCIGHRLKDVPPEKIAEARRLIEQQGIRQDRYDGWKPGTSTDKDPDA